MVRASLLFLRSLILIKRHGGPILKLINKPVHIAWLFFVRSVGVPIYRVSLLIKRLIARVAKPTKHKLLTIITNRYSAHIIMIILVLIVVSTNLNAREAKAETFGQKSILYSLIADDNLQGIEIVAAGDGVARLGSTSSYFSDIKIDSRSHVDLDFLSDQQITSKTGGVPEIQERLIPKREKTEVYVIQEGDTLGHVAELFGLNLSTILWSNNLSFRSTIQPGDSIKVLPMDGVIHKVKSVDTLSRIARKYNVESKDVKKYNKLASADSLSIGKELMIPGGEPPSRSSSVRRTASVASLFVPPPKNVPSGGWVWPTDWRVITQYYGWKHTGLDVDGDYSTHSYASREGRVIYSGWRGGYGLTVEIDHGDGYVTRYAHHSKNFVRVGEIVNAGDAIARTGSTGRSTGTHIHFEVIKNGRFQNPLDYIR